MPDRNQKSGPNIFMIIGIGVVLIIGVMVYLVNNPRDLQKEIQASPEKYLSKNEIEEKEAIALQEDTLKTFFDDQTKGKNIIRSFCPISSPVEFFAVRSWTVVNKVEQNRFQGTYIVRVDSSNRAGLAITKLWKIRISSPKIDGKSFCVASVEEAQ